VKKGFFNKNRLYIGLACVAGIFAILTSSVNFKASYFTPHSFEQSVFDHENKLVVTSKAYTVEDSKKHLKKNLIKFGFQPVQITIHNNTSHSYSIASSGVEIPVATAADIVSKVARSAIPRAIGFKAASLLFWPFNIASTIDGLKGLKDNAKLRRDLSARSFKGGETILPYSIVSRVLFIPAGKFKSLFNIQMFDLSKGAPVTVNIAVANPQTDSKSTMVIHEPQSRFERSLDR
jgi:hypothetical protein